MNRYFELSLENRGAIAPRPSDPSVLGRVFVFVAILKVEDEILEV
ncbi:MAG: hypothetical protein AAGF66_18750 [Cyanobacteria bacterium P01_H01_bin.119]